MREVTKNAPQQAIKNLGTAFKNVFAGTGKCPQFKEKGQHDSFRADNGSDKQHANAVEVNGKECGQRLMSAGENRQIDRFSPEVLLRPSPHAMAPSHPSPFGSRQRLAIYPAINIWPHP